MSAILPHFWEFAGTTIKIYPILIFLMSNTEMDPQYSVLLGEEDKGECSGKSENKKVSTKLILSIVLPLALVAILATALLVSYPR